MILMYFADYFRLLLAIKSPGGNLQFLLGLLKLTSDETKRPTSQFN